MAIRSHNEVSRNSSPGTSRALPDRRDAADLLGLERSRRPEDDRSQRKGPREGVPAKAPGARRPWIRFDTAIQVEPDCYSDILAAVPETCAFGEIIKYRPSDFSDWLAVAEIDYYDLP